MNRASRTAPLRKTRHTRTTRNTRGSSGRDLIEGSIRRDRATSDTIIEGGTAGSPWPRSSGTVSDVSRYCADYRRGGGGVKAVSGAVSGSSVRLDTRARERRVNGGRAYLPAGDATRRPINGDHRRSLRRPPRSGVALVTTMVPFTAPRSAAGGLPRGGGVRARLTARGARDGAARGGGVRRAGRRHTRRRLAGDRLRRFRRGGAGARDHAGHPR